MANGEHNQIQFSFAPVVIPQGDGSYLVRPGKPIPGRERISIAEAAKRFGPSRATLLRLLESGLIQGERPSPRKIFIFVDSLEAHLKASGDPEFWSDQTRHKAFRAAI